jgi:alkylated DNA repair dioxygenase AlkB
MDITIIPESNGTSYFMYYPNFINTLEIKQLLMWLNDMSDFKNNTNYNETNIIRQQKWYQTEQCYFCPHWKHRYPRWDSHAYDEFLIKLQRRIQKTIINELLSEKYDMNVPCINSCLINKYRTNTDRIRPHKDTTKSFGNNPTIIGLSVGSERALKFTRVLNTGSNTHNYKPDILNNHLDFSQKLETGSLYVMGGTLNKYFTHEIPINKHSSGIPRYSLTFREFIH